MAEASPLSIRLGAERLLGVQDHMDRKGLPIRAAVLDLVDIGLATVRSLPAEDHPQARKIAPPGYQPGAVTAAALRALREEPGHD